MRKKKKEKHQNTQKSASEVKASPFFTKAKSSGFYPFTWSFLVLILTFLVFRFTFYFSFKEGAVPLSEFGQSFFLGIKFDARLVLLCLFPQLLLLTFVPESWWRKFPSLYKVSWKISLGLVAFSVLTYLVDLGHYSYLGNRLNFAATDLLGDFWTSMGMVWQTYPVIPGVLLLLAIYYFLFRVFKVIWRIPREQIAKRSLLGTIGSRAIFFLVCVGIGYGKIGHYPLRWSEAYFSTNSFVSQLTLNPVLNFFETRITTRYTSPKAKELAPYYSQIADYYDVPKPQQNAEKVFFSRFHNGTPSSKNAPNVVVLLLESLAANKTSPFGNRLNPTPFLGRLADESVLFTKAFTPTIATARGVFATLTGIPDVAPNKSSSRNPLAINHQLVMNEFKDHQKYYLLGGSANWGNIRSLFGNNLDGVKIFEEGNYSAPRIDVWGISDYDLFEFANNEFKKNEGPFVAFVQSSGFHRPYTIPSHVKGFIPKTDIDKKQLRDYGFHSIDEYNSIYFQDFALQHFFSLAKQESYYENTLFVILGDHGLPSDRCRNMPRVYCKGELAHHHVPLVFHYPRRLAPKKVGHPVSSLDTFATAAKVAGIQFRNTTLGKPLLNSDGEVLVDENNVAFLYSWHQKKGRLTLIGKDYYFNESSLGTHLFPYNDKNHLVNQIDKYPEIADQYRQMARGMLLFSKYLTFNNPKK